jgi:hypothetical protein
MFITPPLVTSYFISRGYVKKDKVQDFLGFKIYPSEYFCPMDFNTHNIEITENTISIHHYLHSWKNK